MCPPITSSLCSCASSGVLRSTFFRNLKSLVGSLPTGVPDACVSLATDAAREVDGRDIGGGGRIGVPTVLPWPGVVDAEMTAWRGLVGVGTASGGPARLRAMMPVSSASNLSRSASAVACGEVKVKLWPASSLTRPTLSRTCAAPTLLRDRAARVSRNMTRDARIVERDGWKCGERRRYMLDLYR